MPGRRYGTWKDTPDADTPTVYIQACRSRSSRPFRNGSGSTFHFRRPSCPKADSRREGQFSLFSFSSEDELLPDAREIREKNIPKEEDRRQKYGRNSRKPATLIVVPTSLLHNWRREAKRFTTLSVAEYNSGTAFPKGHPEKVFHSIHFHLIFTTYG